MPIDLGAVDWLYVVVLAIIAFIATLIGTVLAFRHIFLGAFLSAILFAAGFVMWTYYPHGLPLPTRLTGTASVPAQPAPTARPPVVAPAKPANPVTDITPGGPPANPEPPAKPQ